MKLSSDALHCALRVELAAFDKSRLRARVHALLPLLADRQAFDAATPETASHAQLVDVGARLVTRSRIVAWCRLGEVDRGDRVSHVVDRRVAVEALADAVGEAAEVVPSVAPGAVAQVLTPNLAITMGAEPLPGKHRVVVPLEEGRARRQVGGGRS